MKRLAALLTMTALFAVPSTAQAKGPIGDTEICGDGGCAAVSWDRSVGGPPSLDLFFGQGTSVPDPPPGPYYELRFTVGDSTEHVFVLPGFDVAGTGTAWFRLPPQVAGPIRDGAHSLRPYRVRLASVMVGRTRVENPATYMSLFSLPPGRILASEAYKHSSQWVAIAAITTRTTRGACKPTTTRCCEPRRSPTTSGRRSRRRLPTGSTPPPASARPPPWMAVDRMRLAGSWPASRSSRRPPGWSCWPGGGARGRGRRR
jgi:hypothetical protein